MNQELLDRLQEADPVLWVRYSKVLGRVEDQDQYGWDIYATDLIDSAKEAWLQHCLQEAIRTRGWGYAIGRSSKGMTSASVYVPGGNGDTIMGYDEAEALLRAYIAALSASH